MKPIGTYRNGNYTVKIYSDGTKIRENDLDFFRPEFPESMDIKITNQCDKMCPMCFVAGTKVLMADMTYKNIEDVKIGDEVIAFEERASKRGQNRRILKAAVTNTFVHVESDFVRTVSEDGACIVSTPNHPFLTEGRMKNHSRIFNPIKNVDIGNYLFLCGFPLDNPNTSSYDYFTGYVVGSFVGDGTFKHYIDKKGYDAYNVRFVTKDDEINNAVYIRTKEIIPDIYRLNFKMGGNTGDKSSVRSNKKASYDAIIKLIEDNVGENVNKDYFCGFLAGFCDSEGHVDNQRAIIRLSNTNLKYIREAERCLDGLKIEYSEEAKDPDIIGHKKCFNVRIKGRYAASKFLWYTRPVCNRKSLKNFLKAKFQYHKQKVISKEMITKKQYVYNLETTSHTYIANNFLVHNCHEASAPDGRHGDILNLPFLDTLHPYTELAIGGGNPLSHPDLILFLEGLKKRKLIPSMTVNQTHFLENVPLLLELSDRGLIYGLGVSFISGASHSECNKMIEALEKFPNAVIHVINGIVSVEELHTLAFHDFKILILGYKKFRRGAQNWVDDEDGIVQRQRDLYDELPGIIQSGWFQTTSFDNLAVKQLDVRRLMDDASWERFYMGDDGKYTMYVDAVKREYAVSSVAEARYPLRGNIKEMFDTVLKEAAYQPLL